jgi:Kef-type K+ transport system membrane component KefB
MGNLTLTMKVQLYITSKNRCGGLLLAASVAGKLLGVLVAGALLGWSWAEANVIGWLLQTKALIMIIFDNIPLDKEIITRATFTALLLMAIGSTMLTCRLSGRDWRGCRRSLARSNSHLTGL